MKMIKMALLGGAAIAVTAASARADDMDALKAQIEALNARVAAMETAPSVPTGYQLIAVSEGDIKKTPGVDFTAQELAGYGTRSTIISVLPTADAPAGTTITWSGYARAGLVYTGTSYDNTTKSFGRDGGTNSASTADDFWNDTLAEDGAFEDNLDDWDVKARGQIRVTAATDTAVGEVGVDIRLRANFNGNGAGDVYSDVAWGYWAMTPELTLGGGYNGSLGNIGYGYDGACTCYYTDNAPLALNPGDTTQMRLSYGSGPLTMAVALEDASIRTGADDFDANDQINADQLGGAAEFKYSGDMFSGEIAGVWRGINDVAYTGIRNIDEEGNVTDWNLETGLDALWQVGAGLGFSMGDVAKLSIGGAFGEGPITQQTDGQITGVIPIDASWWAITALATINMTDEFHAEIGAGYKSWDGNDVNYETASEDDNQFGQITDYEQDTWGVQGGLYYTPVDQLTVGLEAEWYQTDASFTDTYNDDPEGDIVNKRDEKDLSKQQLTVDLVSVWRF